MVGANTYYSQCVASGLNLNFIWATHFGVTITANIAATFEVTSLVSIVSKILKILS